MAKYEPDTGPRRAASEQADAEAVSQHKKMAMGGTVNVSPKSKSTTTPK